MEDGGVERESERERNVLCGSQRCRRNQAVPKLREREREKGGEGGKRFANFLDEEKLDYEI